MTIPPDLLPPLWPASQVVATNLLPVAPADLSPSAAVAGVSFVRQSSALANQGTVDPSSSIFPPCDGTDTTGALSLAWLLQADNAFAAPIGATPQWIDFMFTSRPGLNRPARNDVRLIVSAYGFSGANAIGPGSVPLWGPLGGPAFVLLENQRLRVPWETLVGSARAGVSTECVVDAFAFVPMVPALRTIPPGRSLTFAMLAGFT